MLKDGMVQKGFTLIDLLIVTALLAVLIVGIIAMINPLEQMRKGDDIKRKTAINQLYKATQSYYTTHADYINPPSNHWITDLVNAYEIQSAPAIVNYRGSTQICTVWPQNGYCYNTINNEAIIYTKLESIIEKDKCLNPNSNPYFLWSSVNSANGLICLEDDPTDPGFYALVQ
ncbi:MAG: type II secretion system protein [Candidatus Levybacteria bacterium]|nr:type II secretion system protein [Candidatus Levybacteria bacterium]